MAQHKWHKEIKAWADGAIIQYKDINDRDEWIDTFDNDPAWEVAEFLEYRIKPQPKEPQYLYAFRTSGNMVYWFEEDTPRPSMGYIGKIKLEVND